MKSLQKLRTSLLSRTLSTSKTAVGIASKVTQNRMRRLFANPEEKERLKAEELTAIAEHVAEELGQLKGLVMKVGQMTSYIDIGLPENVRNILATLQDSTMARIRQKPQSAESRFSARSRGRRTPQSGT